MPVSLCRYPQFLRVILFPFSVSQPFLEISEGGRWRLVIMGLPCLCLAGSKGAVCFMLVPHLRTWGTRCHQLRVLKSHVLGIGKGLLECVNAKIRHLALDSGPGLAVLFLWLKCCFRWFLVLVVLGVFSGVFWAIVLFLVFMQHSGFMDSAIGNASGLRDPGHSGPDGIFVCRLSVLVVLRYRDSPTSCLLPTPLMTQQKAGG